MHKNNDDEGYFIYTPLTTEMDFGWYTGYGMGNPDGYPRIRVGLYVDPEAPGAEAAIAAIKQVSLLEGWEDNWMTALIGLRSGERQVSSAYSRRKTTLRRLSTSSLSR